MSRWFTATVVLSVAVASLSHPTSVARGGRLDRAGRALRGHDKSKPSAQSPSASDSDSDAYRWEDDEDDADGTHRDRYPSAPVPPPSAYYHPFNPYPTFGPYGFFSTPWQFYGPPLAHSAERSENDTRTRPPLLGRLYAGLTMGHDGKNLSTFGIEGQLDLAIPFGLRAEYRGLTENLGAEFEPDRVALGDFALLWRCVELPFLQAYAGFGFATWNDATGDLIGHRFSLQLEFQPVYPLTTGVRLAYGPLGEGQVFTARPHVGLQLWHFELRGAFDYLAVAGVPLHTGLVILAVHY